jgi:hypothetical protein
MHLNFNYAREHWTNPGENPPVGLILCTQRDAAVAHYALEALLNKVLVGARMMPGVRWPSLWETANGCNRRDKREAA